MFRSVSNSYKLVYHSNNSMNISHSDKKGNGVRRKHQVCFPIPSIRLHASRCVALWGCTSVSSFWSRRVEEKGSVNRLSPGPQAQPARHLSQPIPQSSRREGSKRRVCALSHPLVCCGESPKRGPGFECGLQGQRMQVEGRGGPSSQGSLSAQLPPNPSQVYI